MLFFLSLSKNISIPLSWGLLRAFCENNPILRDNYQWEEPFISPDIDSVINSICKLAKETEMPFILAASCYVWNFDLNMNVFSAIKRKYHHCITVAGGPHIPDEPDNIFFQHPEVDILVHGEGETVFHDILIELLNANPSYDNIRGISFCYDNNPIKNEPASSILPRDIPNTLLPSPYLLGYFDNIVKNNPSFNNFGYTALIETTRGCPMACAYCYWGGGERMKLVKIFDYDRVVDEIDWAVSHGATAIVLCDSNWGYLPRDVELTQYVVDMKNKYRQSPGSKNLLFYACSAMQLNLQNVYEIGVITVRGGLSSYVSTSLQSLNQDTISAIGRKRSSIDKTSLRKLKDEYDREQIPTFVELMFPLPQETPETFIDGLCELLELGFHEDIRCYLISILPNTRLSTPEMLGEYDIKTATRAYAFRSRRMPYLPDPEIGSMYNEIVIRETNTISTNQMCECLSFHCSIIKAMHQGGYTRYLINFLRKSSLIPSYRDFYVQLFSEYQKTTSLIGRLIKMNHNAWERVLKDDVGPHYEDASMLLANTFTVISDYYGLKMSWQLFEPIWIAINQAMDQFYSEIRSFLSTTLTNPAETWHGIKLNLLIDDLLRFQQSMMLTPIYDSKIGKDANFLFSWPEFFWGDGQLVEESVSVHFGDIAFGIMSNRTFRPGNLRSFANAALGAWQEGSYCSYMHQPEACTWSPKHSS